jgi:hypothetical protein
VAFYRFEPRDQQDKSMVKLQIFLHATCAREMSGPDSVATQRLFKLSLLATGGNQR